MTKWFWLIGSSNTVDRPLVADSEDLRGFSEWDLTEGRVIEGWDQDAAFWPTKPEHDGQPGDVLVTAVGVIYVFSQRLQFALAQAGISDVQYLPVRVRRSDGSGIGGYAIANVLTVVPALDRPRSALDFFPSDYFLADRRGQIAGIRRPVLCASALDGADVIRLKEFPASVYVSDRFVTVFEEGGFTGCSFVEVGVSLEEA